MFSQLELYLSRRGGNIEFVAVFSGATAANAMVGWHFMTTRNNKAHVIGRLVTFFEYLHSGLW